MYVTLQYSTNKQSCIPSNAGPHLTYRIDQQGGGKGTTSPPNKQPFFTKLLNLDACQVFFSYKKHWNAVEDGSRAVQVSQFA